MHVQIYHQVRVRFVREGHVRGREDLLQELPIPVGPLSPRQL